MCRNFCFFRLFSHFSSASLLSLSLSLYNSFVSRALALTYTLSLRRSNFYELACRFNCFILVFLFSVSVFQCSRCCLFPFRSLVLSYCRCSRLECVRQRFIYSSICSWCTLFTIEHTQYSHTNTLHIIIIIASRLLTRCVLILVPLTQLFNIVQHDECIYSFIFFMEISVMRRQKFHSIKSYFLIDDWDEGDDDNDDYDDYISLSQSIYQVQNDIESCWSINCDVFSVSNGFNCHCYYGQRWYANDERWNIEIRALKNVLLFRLLISASIQLFVFLELICSRSVTPQRLSSVECTRENREKNNSRLINESMWNSTTVPVAHQS